MKKESIILLAQLLTMMRDSVKKLDDAEQKKDWEKVAMLKQEVLTLQIKIDELL